MPRTTNKESFTQADVFQGDEKEISCISTGHDSYSTGPMERLDLAFHESRLLVASASQS